jgi:hypothetical protein
MASALRWAAGKNPFVKQGRKPGTCEEPTPERLAQRVIRLVERWSHHYYRVPRVEMADVIDAALMLVMEHFEEQDGAA